MKAAVDLSQLSEDARIGLMRAAIDRGATIAFIVRDDEIADRYVRKFGAGVRVVSRHTLPVNGQDAPAIVVKIGPVKH